MTGYLIDTNVVIRAKNEHYGFNICPGFWRWLDNEHAARKIFSVHRVYDEIVSGKDELVEWAKQRRGFFLKPRHGLAASLVRVSRWANANFPRSAVTAFLGKADYYLVAQAHESGYTVVTYEVSAPRSNKSIKIPDACNEIGVAWTTPHEMLHREGARFALIL